MAATLGYWDGPPDSPRSVADTYLQALTALTDEGAYLSIKLPALKFSAELACEVARAAAAAGVRIHCDAHDVELVDQTKWLTEEMLRSRRGRRLHACRTLAAQRRRRAVGHRPSPAGAGGQRPMGRSGRSRLAI